MVEQSRGTGAKDSLRKLGELRAEDGMEADVYRPGHKSFGVVERARCWSWMKRSPWLLCARGERESEVTCVDAFPLHRLLDASSPDRGVGGKVRLVPVAGFLRAAVKRPYCAWALSEDWFLSGDLEGAVFAWSLRGAHAAKYMGPWWIDDDLPFDRLSDLEPRAKPCRGHEAPVAAVALVPGRDRALSFDVAGNLRCWQCRELHPPRMSPLTALEPLWSLHLDGDREEVGAGALELSPEGEVGLLHTPRRRRLVGPLEPRMTGSTPSIATLEGLGPEPLDAATFIGSRCFVVAQRRQISLYSWSMEPASLRLEQLDALELDGEALAQCWLAETGLLVTLVAGDAEPKIMLTRIDVRSGRFRQHLLERGSHIAGGPRRDGDIALAPAPSSVAFALCSTSGLVEVFELDCD